MGSWTAELLSFFFMNNQPLWVLSMGLGLVSGASFRVLSSCQGFATMIPFDPGSTSNLNFCPSRAPKDSPRQILSKGIDVNAM